MKALMLIAMLAVSEGRRLQQINEHSDQLTKANRAFSSHEAAGNEASTSLDLDQGAPVQSPMDMMLQDPAFKEQMDTMAGHMEEFAVLMQKKAPTGLLSRANNMANELFELSTDSKSSDDSTLPEDMELMIADKTFQKYAQVFADKMQKSVKVDTDFQEEWEAATSQQTATTVSETLAEVTSDPEFQQASSRVSDAWGSFMQDPEMLSQAETLALYVESMKDSQAHDSAEEVSEQFNAMMANPILKAKASAVVAEMLKADTTEIPPSEAADEFMKEMAAMAENPPQEVLEAMGDTPEVMEQLKKVLGSKTRQDLETAMDKTVDAMQAAHPSLLEESSDAVKPSAAARAFHLPRVLPRKNHVADTDQRTYHHDPSQPSHGIEPGSEQSVKDIELDRISVKDAGSDAEESTEEKPASQPAVFLTSAKGIRSMLPSFKKALQRRGSLSKMAAKDGDSDKKKGFSLDVPLLLCFALWYLGNYNYNITNKLALNAAGGASTGFPLTVATLQLGVGALYCLFLWAAPDARKAPEITFKDYVSTLPLAGAFAGAHAATTVAMGAGSVSFAQIVKAAEPAFAALLGTFFYNSKISTAKWLMLIPVIGGVCLASLGEMNFAIAALVSAAMANMFAAVKGQENAKLFKTPGIKERMGSVGNQVAITTINSFLLLIPVALISEGARMGEFMTLLKTSPTLVSNLIQAGMWFYLYSEFATLTIPKTSAVTQSVANTAKRVIVIVGVALVMKESLTPLKLIGSGIGITGVFFYSIIDSLVENRKNKKKAIAAPTTATSM
jgi:solute carrier family 35 protein E1